MNELVEVWGSEKIKAELKDKEVKGAFIDFQELILNRMRVIVL